VVSARSLLLASALAAASAQAQTPARALPPFPGQAAALPVHLDCAMDAMGGDPPYRVFVGFDQKDNRVYTSRGGKIANATITDDTVTILHTVTPPDGEREVTTTTIDRHSGKIVIARDGGGVIETGTCKVFAK
jgi:hypothetical protein